MKNTIMWLFTRAKDSRNLLKISKEILVFNQGGSLNINPMQVPVTAKAWSNCFADTFIQANALFDGTKNFLLDELSYLYSQNDMPTIHDLFRVIKALEFQKYSRDARYQESAINRLSGLINSLGDNFSFPCIDLKELMKRHVIFEIQSLTSEQQVFMVNILLSWLFYYKLHYENPLYHVIGIDDANLIFDKSFEYRPDRGLPIISHLITTVRKAKIRIIADSQIPHQIGASLHSNSFTKIMFSLSNGRDIECMTRSMGIRDPEQIQYCHRLGKREIVVKFSGRYQAPFLAYIPELEIFDGVISDSEVMQNNKRILESMTQLRAPRYIEPIKDDSSKPKSDRLSDEEKAFLADIYLRPYISVTERHKSLILGG